MVKEGYDPFYWDHLSKLKSTTPFDYDSFFKFCHLNSKILDIGCGYGRICYDLESAGYTDICGLDTSITQIRRAKSILKFTKLCLANALNLPFTRNSFDNAIALGLINCLIYHNDLEQFVTECHRVIKSGGFLFINMFSRNDSPYFDNKYDAGYRKFRVKRVFQSNTGIIFRHYSISELLSCADKHFDLICSAKKSFFSMNQKRMVSGYQIILQKTAYRSRYR